MTKLRWLVKRVPRMVPSGNTESRPEIVHGYRELRTLQEWVEGPYGVDGHWLDVPTVTEEES